MKPNLIGGFFLGCRLKINGYQFLIVADWDGMGRVITLSVKVSVFYQTFKSSSECFESSNHAYSILRLLDIFSKFFFHHR